MGNEGSMPCHSTHVCDKPTTILANDFSLGMGNPREVNIDQLFHTPYTKLATSPQSYWLEQDKWGKVIFLCIQSPSTMHYEGR
jgi:hypothetical protein